VKENNALLFKFLCNIFIGVRIIKEIPGSVASGTLCIIKVGSQKTYGASITRTTRQMIFIGISHCVCSEKQIDLTDKFYGQTVVFNLKALDTQLMFLLEG
jgi:hypothetical protein